jgi:hypothetical protein
VKRRLFNVLAGVSLVLCVTTATMGVRSYWRMDEFQGNYRPKLASFDLDANFFSVAGRVRLGLQHEDGPNGFVRSQYTSDFDEPLPGPWASIPLGLGGGRILLANHSAIGWSIGATLPWYAFALFFAISPALWTVLRLQAHSSTTGFCPNCDYDLRATPDRCPECGTVTAKGIS